MDALLFLVTEIKTPQTQSTWDTINLYYACDVILFIYFTDFAIEHNTYTLYYIKLITK